MLSSLRIRLTAVFTALTVLVLTAAVGTAFYFTITQYSQAALQRFEAAFEDIAEKLRTGELIQGQMLSQREAEIKSIIYIEDNGTPLVHSSQKKGVPTRKQLADAAKVEALENGFDLRFTHSREKSRQFEFTLDNKKYIAATMHLPKAEQRYVLLFVIRPENADYEHILSILYTFSLLWAACAVALCIVSFMLCGAALRPTRLALKRQAEFTAAASHEIRGPAAVISANLSAVRNKNIEPQQAQEFIKAASDEAQRLSRLAADLTTLACGDAGRSKPLCEKINPDTICIELYEKYYTLSSENEHVLDVSLPEQRSTEIYSDKQRLLQLLGIFVLNALQHTASGCKINISFSQAVHRTVFTISDNGEGIDAEDKPFIYERFYKADKSRTDKSHFGLGLSIAKAIADELHVKIELTDTFGGGTTFKVIITGK